MISGLRDRKVILDALLQSPPALGGAGEPGREAQIRFLEGDAPIFSCFRIGAWMLGRGGEQSDADPHWERIDWPRILGAPGEDFHPTGRRHELRSRYEAPGVYRAYSTLRRVPCVQRSIDSASLQGSLLHLGYNDNTSSLLLMSVKPKTSLTIWFSRNQRENQVRASGCR